MKNLLIIALILVGSASYGQSKKEMLAKKWKLNKIEEFGQQFDPMDHQKNDWIEFTADGKFTGIVESKHVQGTWSAGKSVVVKVDKVNSNVKINWTKVKKVEVANFALEYQNGDLITSTMLFVPAQ